MRCIVTLFSWLLAASVIGFVAIGPATAGSIIITGENATIVPNVMGPPKTGTVDFMISSASSIDPVNLAIFSLQLQITDGSGNSFSNLLRFTDSQPLVFDQGNYVFFGTSAASSSIWSNPVGPTISASDFNLDSAGDPANKTISSSFLLARVQFSIDDVATLGDSFTISLVPDNDFFFSEAFETIDFTSTSATVTVGEAELAAVPEPASMTLLGIGGFGMAAYARYRLKRKNAQ